MTTAEFPIIKRNYLNWSMAFKEVADMDWSIIKSCLLYNIKDNIYPDSKETNLLLISIIDSFIDLSME